MNEAASVAGELGTPPWLEGLPKDRRGFPIPAEAPWQDGEPKLTLIGNSWKLALAFTRACAVCGYELTMGRNVYRAFSQADAAQIRGYERNITQDLGSPGHLSCMLYSAQICPYLKYPTARLGKDSLVGPGVRRGTTAAILGFKDYQVLLPMVENLSERLSTGPGAYFAYENLIEDHRFKLGTDLAELYEQAIVVDGEHIDVASQRNYWTVDGSESMVQIIRDNVSHLTKAGPTRTLQMFGEMWARESLPVQF